MNRFCCCVFVFNVYKIIHWITYRVQLTKFEGGTPWHSNFVDSIMCLKFWTFKWTKIEKKSKYFCAEFFQKVKAWNFISRKCDFFLKGLTTPSYYSPKIPKNGWKYITFWKLQIMKNRIFYSSNYKPGQKSWPVPKSHP